MIFLLFSAWKTQRIGIRVLVCPQARRQLSQGAAQTCPVSHGPAAVRGGGEGLRESSENEQKS